MYKNLAGRQIVAVAWLSMDIDEVNNRNLMDKAHELFARAIAAKATKEDGVLFWDIFVAPMPSPNGIIILPVFIMGVSNPIIGAPAITPPAAVIAPPEASCQISSVEKIVDGTLSACRMAVSAALSEGTAPIPPDVLAQLNKGLNGQQHN